MVQLHGKQFDSSSKKKDIEKDIESSYDLVIPFLGIYPEELKAGTLRYLHIMFTAALFKIAKGRQNPNNPVCPLIDEWVNQMWSIQAVEYYSALKRNEILIHVTAWMKLENMLCESS